MYTNYKSSKTYLVAKYSVKPINSSVVATCLHAFISLCSDALVSPFIEPIELHTTTVDTTAQQQYVLTVVSTINLMH
jgi:hypothetical protein